MNKLEKIMSSFVGGIASPIWIPLQAMNLYEERTRDFRDQQKGRITIMRLYSIIKEPTIWEAIRDAASFQWAYVRSGGEINTSNWDFDKRLKEAAEYNNNTH